MKADTGDMNNTQYPEAYDSARDLPSVQEVRQQIAAFKLLGFLLTKEHRAKLKKLNQDLRKIIAMVDKFYELV